MLSYEFGESCVPLANALSEHADVCLILPTIERDLFDGPVAPSVEYMPFEKPRFRQAWRQVRALTRILRRIRDFAPDVVHIQQGQLWLNYALRFLRRYPLVVTVHDAVLHPGDRESARTPQRAMTRAFGAADEVIVHGRSVGDDLVETVGVPRDRIHVVPHRVDPFASSGAPPEPEPATALFFGRIWPYKGLDVLIAAEPLVAQDVPSLKIVIGGEGEPFDRYRSLMKHPERFEVHYGLLDNDERNHLFQRAAIVVLPYVEASQSGVVPVAYAFGRPVVASAVGGLPEAVEEGVTGLLVPPSDPVALAAAMTRLLCDDELRATLGANARRRFASGEMSEEAIAQRTLTVYQRALARRVT